MFSGYTSLELSKFMEMVIIEFGFSKNFSFVTIKLNGSGHFSFMANDVMLKLTFRNGEELGDFIRSSISGNALGILAPKLKGEGTQVFEIGDLNNELDIAQW